MSTDTDKVTKESFVDRLGNVFGFVGLCDEKWNGFMWFGKGFFCGGGVGGYEKDDDDDEV